MQDMPDIPIDIPQDQLQRGQRVLDQVLNLLRSRSRSLPPEAGLALTYELQPMDER